MTVSTMTRAVAATPASRAARPAPMRAFAAALLLAVVPAALVLAAAPAAAQRLAPDAIRERVETRLPHAFETYRTLLTFPNDAHRPEDMLRLVAWLEDAFTARGFSTERLPTPGSPLLLAARRTPGASRTVLVYLQADGQPVDPSAWEQENPYVPVLKEPDGAGGWRALPWARLEAAARQGEEALNPEWRVFARSASDSKGPVAQFLAALDVIADAGVDPDVHLKVIVDTEEEMGSPHLPAALVRHRDRLAADALVIFDGPPHVSGRPTLKFGARGIATATLITYGPRVPQHSGHYGNYAPNPAFRLAEILASLKDRHGRVRIPGWYDGVALDSATKRILAEVPDDEDWIRRQLGIATRDSVGDNLQEAVQYPSLNVRGMAAGWIGDDARTIVPATATAELDIRLVRESDPERLLGLLRGHIEGLGYTVLDRAPSDAERLAQPRLATLTYNVSYGAFRTDFDSEPGRWLTAALTHLHGHDPIRIRTSGGSIPISPFVETLGIPAVSVPTVNPDNNQHSPNENLRVDAFAGGIRVMVAVLAQPFPREATDG